MRDLKIYSRQVEPEKLLATSLQSSDLSPELSEVEDCAISTLVFFLASAIQLVEFQYCCLKIIYSPQSTFTEEETEVQRGPVTCPQSHGRK